MIEMLPVEDEAKELTGEVIEFTKPNMREMFGFDEALVQMKTQAGAVQIQDASDASNVAGQIVYATGKRKEAEAWFKDRTSGLKLIIADTKAMVDPRIDACKSVEDILRGKLGAYQTRLDQEAAERAWVEAAEYQKRLAKNETAKRPVAVVPPPPPMEIPANQIKTETGNISFTTKRTPVLVDESKVPDEYWILDEVKIGKIIRAGGEVPGYRVNIEKVPTVRS